MPRLSTPRILPTLRSSPVPGMWVPGGANTPFMPARALGAPHTTCTGAPVPVSTMHTRSRSALGWRSAEITRAMMKAPSSLALSSTRSTSSPIMVRRSTIASSDAAVSRCSPSHARVNFIAAPRRTRPCISRRATSRFAEGEPASPSRGEANGARGPVDTSSSPKLHHPRASSPTQASRERRKIERAEAVVLEPAHVRLEERAQVRHAVFEHGDAIDPHAPGKALEGIGVDAAVLQHLGMHHSAAEDFQPVLAFAEPDAVLVAPALNVDFERGIGEREIRRPKPHLDVIDLEKRLAELLEDPFEVAEVRLPVDHQTFDLVEHRRMGLVGIAPVGAAGTDHPDRRFLMEHGADLHRRGVGAQQQARAVRLLREEERV